MQYKETNKQKFYMRNVYINQIMKPEIQNNLNYAYFENPSKPSDYFNNQIPDLNQENIFFNNDTFKSIYHNCFPNKKSSTNNIKKNYSKKNNNKKEVILKIHIRILKTTEFNEIKRITVTIKWTIFSMIS